MIGNHSSMSPMNHEKINTQRDEDAVPEAPTQLSGARVCREPIGRILSVLRLSLPLSPRQALLAASPIMSCVSQLNHQTSEN